jgi:prepilin-type N-terminal cleavage/methylation domain-containing protein
MQKKTNSGFTLIELVVSLGISSIATLGILSLYKNSTNISSSSIADFDKNEISSELHLATSSKDICSFNFNGVEIGTTDITRIRDTDGRDLFAEGSMYGTANSIRLDNLDLTKINQTSALLTVTMSQLKPTIKTFNRTIVLDVELGDSNVIRSCYSNITDISSGSVDLSCNGSETVIFNDPTPATNGDGDETCTHIGFSTEECNFDGANYTEAIKGFYIDSAYKMIRPSCVSLATPPATSRCPDGQLVERIDAAGNVICRAITINDVQGVFTNLAYKNCDPTNITISSSGGKIDVNCP